MSNLKIRSAAMADGVRHYQIAHALGIEETAFSKLLRTEVDETMQEKILSAIADIAQGKNGSSV